MAFAAPAALAGPALGLGAAGAGISAFGAIEGGQATAKAANYSAAVSRNNAVIANQNADYSIASGLEKADTASRKNAAIGGRIKATQAANGIDVNSGSAVDVQAGQRETGELDASTVLNNAELTAYGYRNQASSYTAQSQLQTAEAEQAPIGADLKAAGGLLSSASGLGTKWASLGNPGSSPGSPLSLDPTDYT